jgi:hypothetical protein
MMKVKCTNNSYTCLGPVTALGLCRSCYKRQYREKNLNKIRDQQSKEKNIIKIETENS